VLLGESASRNPSQRLPGPEIVAGARAREAAFPAHAGGESIADEADGSARGAKRGYPKQPGVRRGYDPALFDALAQRRRRTGLKALTLSLALLHRPQHFERVRADSSRDSDEFRRVEPALAALIFRDERLRPPQRLGERGLGDASGLPGVDQLLKRAIVELSK
jgi:hypothetical protein